MIVRCQVALVLFHVRCQAALRRLLHAHLSEMVLWSSLDAFLLTCQIYLIQLVSKLQMKIRLWWRKGCFSFTAHSQYKMRVRFLLKNTRRGPNICSLTLILCPRASLLKLLWICKGHQLIHNTWSVFQNPNLLGKENVKDGSEEVVGVAKQEEEHWESVDRLVQRRSWLIPAMSRAQGDSRMSIYWNIINVWSLHWYTDVLLRKQNKTTCGWAVEPVAGQWSQFWRAEAQPRMGPTLIRHHKNLML